MEITRAVLQQAPTANLERLARSLGLQVLNRGPQRYRKALIAAILAKIGPEVKHDPMTGYMR